MEMLVGIAAGVGGMVGLQRVVARWGLGGYNWVVGRCFR